LVLDKYGLRVRYRYVERPAEASVLIVDSKWLMADAQAASLGEFVVGRLLNVYVPLEGAQFLQEVELVYKKRVMLESIYEVAANQNGFAPILIIPLEYFLFEKLRKRALIYPPAQYSYARTYSGPNAESNLAASLERFYEAALSLEKQGILKLEDHNVRITAPQGWRQLSKVSSAIVYAARGLTQYAVHGYAGRVSVNTVKKEALSKIRRIDEAGILPSQIQKPKSIWRIEEGALITGGDSWVPAAARFYCLRPEYSVHQEDIHDTYPGRRVYLLDDGEKQARVVVKDYGEFWSLRWTFFNLLVLNMRHFDTDPLSRLARECSAITYLSRRGLNTPRIICVCLDERKLISNFIDGVSLSTVVNDLWNNADDGLELINLVGRSLSALHREGYTLGDSRPSNMLHLNGKLFLVDLEQAVRGGDPSWDIAEFLYYSCLMRRNEQRAKSIADAFLHGYLQHGEKHIVNQAASRKYALPFQAVTSPAVIKTVRNSIKESSC